MIVDIDRTNVESAILEGSKNKYVFVYLFDPEDSRTEGLTASLSMQIGAENPDLVLAKVNLRQTPELARMLPVRELPSLVVIKDGQMAGQLEGEAAYAPDEFLKKFKPQEDELLYQEAAKLLAEEKAEAAMDKINAAIELNDKSLYRLTRAEILIKQNKLDEAEAILNAMTMEEQLDNDAYYKTLMSTLNLARQALEDSPVEDLKKQLESDPDNLDLKIELAVQLNKLSQKTEALDLLYSVLARDLNYKEAKKTYLDILETMGSSSTVSGYRRKLYTLMY